MIFFFRNVNIIFDELKICFRRRRSRLPFGTVMVAKVLVWTDTPLSSLIFFWNLIKVVDVMKFFQDFHETVKLTEGCTSSFLALIPKSKNPQSLYEYRPICLVESLYKILAKLLAGRMRRVIGKLVSPNQTAFVPDRNIADGVLIVNEVLDLAKRERRHCVAFKVDFEKSYNRVSWNFLRHVLSKMGFVARWMSWMEGCIEENFKYVQLTNTEKLFFIL